MSVYPSQTMVCPPKGCVPPVLGHGVSSAPPQIVRVATNLVPPHLATHLAFTGSNFVELVIVGGGLVFCGLIAMAGRSGRKAGEL